jgi:hypothetical protein
MLELLGRAGCVSIEAGVESLTREGRDRLDKNCKLETEELADRLVEAKRHVPFVQANLLEVPQDDDGAGRGVALAAARGGGVGERPGAAVPLPGLARLPAAVGPARRRGVGARGRPLPGRLRRLQRHPGGAAAAAAELEARA